MIPLACTKNSAEIPLLLKRNILLFTSQIIIQRLTIRPLMSTIQWPFGKYLIGSFLKVIKVFIYRKGVLNWFPDFWWLDAHPKNRIKTHVRSCIDTSEYISVDRTGTKELKQTHQSPRFNNFILEFLANISGEWSISPLICYSLSYCSILWDIRIIGIWFSRLWNTINTGTFITWNVENVIKII